MLLEDAFIASGLVNLGYFPCTSEEPTVVVTTRVLELFRVTRLRCPRLAIQPFVKSLCDLHGVPFRPYLATQFSITYDLYLATLAIVDKRVMALLGRNTPHWRLKNTCPCCMYKLEGEPEMLLPILTTKDGNNSLKRFFKRERNEDGTPGASKERLDERQPPGDVYLTREEVDAWGKEGLEELMKDFSSEGFDSEEPEVRGVEDGGCSERWQNMKEEITSKAWGMYDETGVFLSLCHHGFVLIIADMVRSGELAKYGYAVVNHLIHVLGEVASGYDIGCKFGQMVNLHPILGPLARAHKFRSLVGAFHGHGHNRRCQLCNLATYVTGVGLEDLEECETFFSKSNALAASTRYASRFHRQQAIATYLQHTDIFDTYSSLSLLLANKYKRALEVKSTTPALAEAMRDLGVQSTETFEAWLAREKEVLQSLTREPLEETLQMEYYQKLVNLEEQTKRMEAALLVPVPVATAGGDYAEEARSTRQIESQRRHAMELHNKVLLAVQDLERRLGGVPRWVRGSDEWVATEKMVQRRRYQRTLDQLQGLIIARMFGYKLRKHIAKALQARSRAVKTALINYNAAASALQPPRDALTWEQVVEYAFLSDFDLLRDGREDIRSEPWARPAGRLAMDLYFKLLRADEEIIRLNIEIRRFMTYMRDEEAFLLREEGRVEREHGVALAYQVRRYRMRQGRFNDDHRYHLVKLARVPGFTGRLDPGVPVNKERLVGAPTGLSTSPTVTLPTSDSESDSDSDDEAEDIAVQFALMQVTEDAAGGVGGRDA
ncbi:hypothetical protein C8R43DRAFT_910591 [Mycena crocata]|nr:hypothetical protein C8R43DRAFT_910591 [Mycena crocata]